MLSTLCVCYENRQCYCAVHRCLSHKACSINSFYPHSLVLRICFSMGTKVYLASLVICGSHPETICCWHSWLAELHLPQPHWPYRINNWYPLIQYPSNLILADHENWLELFQADVQFEQKSFNTQALVNDGPFLAYRKESKQPLNRKNDLFIYKLTWELGPATNTDTNYVPILFRKSWWGLTAITSGTDSGAFIWCIVAPDSSVLCPWVCWNVNHSKVFAGVAVIIFLGRVKIHARREHSSWQHLVVIMLSF